jgi:tryptophanyl-tRNA synthetase
MRVLSGIQPTGKLHIGTYLGAIRPFLDFQHAHEASQSNIFLIADLHGLTKPQMVDNRKELRIAMARSLLALGLNPAHSIIAQQSCVRPAYY